MRATMIVIVLKLLFIKEKIMAKEKKVSRKDSKGRVLRKGESERKDGTYMFRYNDERKKKMLCICKNIA